MKCNFQFVPKTCLTLIRFAVNLQFKLQTLKVVKLSGPGPPTDLKFKLNLSVLSYK